ncbi:MAG: hypothetical protein JJT96_17235 [Opitutales bacterium]|nr:hypothetical protein [Opitutales bacterium]
MGSVLWNLQGRREGGLDGRSGCGGATGEGNDALAPVKAVGHPGPTIRRAAGWDPDESIPLLLTGNTADFSGIDGIPPLHPFA